MTFYSTIKQDTSRLDASQLSNPFTIFKRINNPFTEVQQQDVNPFLKLQIAKNPFIAFRDVQMVNPFTTLQSANPFVSLRNKISQIIQPVRLAPKSITKTNIESRAKTQLSTKQLKLVKELATMPPEQIAVISSLINDTPEVKETIALEAFAIQQNEAIVTNKLRENLYQTWLQNKTKIYYLAAKVTLVVMTAVVLSVSWEIGAFWTLNNIWNLFGWKGLSLMLSMAGDVVMSTGTGIGVETGFNYLLRKNDRFWGLVQGNLFTVRQKQVLQRLGISAERLNVTYEDMLRSSLHNTAMLYRIGDPLAFIYQKGFGLAVSTGISTASKTQQLLQTGREKLSLFPSAYSLKIRQFQELIHNIPSKTQEIIQQLEMTDIKQDLNTLALELTNNAQPELEKIDYVPQIKPEIPREKILSSKTAGAVTTISAGIVTALIAGQIDVSAYTAAAQEMIIQSAIGTQVLTRTAAQSIEQNVGVITKYISSQLEDSPLVRRLVFSAIFAKSGLPNLLVKFGKFLTVEQIAKLNLLDKQILSASDREKNGLIKVFCDTLFGRYYTSKEISTMTREQLIAILKSNKIAVKPNTPVATLRKMVQSLQRDKQAITYQMVVESLSNQIGTASVSLILENNVEHLWNNRQVLLDTIHNTNLPLFDSNSPYYITPDQRSAFNIMIRSKDFIAQHVVQGAQAMYQNASDGVETMAAIALEKVNMYLMAVSSTDAIRVNIPEQTTAQNIDTAFANIQNAADEKVSISPMTFADEIARTEDAILLLSRAQTEQEKLNDSTNAAISLETQATANFEIQKAKRAAIENAINTYKLRTGNLPAHISDVITSTSLSAEIAALLPASITYNKQDWLKELTSSLAASPAEFHKIQTRLEARAQAELHKQARKTAHIIKEAEDLKEQSARQAAAAVEKLENIKNRRDAIARAKQRLQDRLRASLDLPSTLISGELGTIKVNADSIITNQKVMDALNYEFTPLIRKLVQTGALHTVNWIPGIGWINNIVTNINTGLDNIQTGSDLANIMLKINAAIPISQEETISNTIRQALPESLPVEYIPSWRLPSLSAALEKIVDAPKVNLRNIIFDTMIKGQVFSWGREELALNIAKEIAGNQDIENISEIMNLVSRFITD